MFLLWYVFMCFCFFKQKTAYEMRISDWSSDVCSSDLFEDPDTYRRLGDRLRQDNRGNAIFYLATAPRFFGPIVERLAAAGLTAEGEGCFRDRKSVVSGKSGYVRVDLGGGRSSKKKKTNKTELHNITHTNSPSRD